jgi:hypothetical protein
MTKYCNLYISPSKFRIQATSIKAQSISHSLERTLKSTTLVGEQSTSSATFHTRLFITKMRNTNLRSAGLIISWLLALTPLTQAHTWVEQLNVISSNGTFVGAAGFPRGNVLRTNPAFGDPQMTNLIPPDGRSTGTVILPTDLMCKASQSIGNQTSGSPALIASAGDMVALRYQENGHVTLPQNQPGKPANRGTVFIYGTTQPSNRDTLLGIHNVWTADGKGGDGRGVLLATRNFDDGQCYQVNSGTISQQRQKQFPHTPDSLMGTNLWCQSDVTLPSSISSSTYTLYWVWDWPTAAGTAGFPNGKNETYTTCMDISISGGTGSSNDLSFAKNQDLNSAAIESELSTAFIVPVTSEAAGSQPTAAAQSTSPKAAASTTAAATNRVGVVTVTELIHDTVTIYQTQPTSPSPAAASSAKATAVPVSEAPNGAITVAPFQTGKIPSSLTTLATKAVAAAKVVVTTVSDIVVESVSVTSTVYATSETPAPPKIRGRSLGSGHPLYFGGG